MKLLTWLRPFMLPINEIHRAVPGDGLTYEIGSGYGSLAHMIAQKGSKRTVIGVDTDQQKVADAQSQLQLVNLQFQVGDALTFHFKPCVGLVMSDFLHHVPYPKQELILERLSKSLKKNGVMVIKEIDRADGLLMYLSRLWDFLLYPKDAIYYRSSFEWEQLLKRYAFSVSVRRAVPWFPGSTHLFICTKK